MTSRLIEATELRPGDRIDTLRPDEPTAVVLREGEWQRETMMPLTGRPVLRVWCRVETTGREGYMSFGPGGRALLVSA